MKRGGQLAHHADVHGARILTAGPPIRFKPATAQAIGMVLHELATNAAKYGALSVPEGRVRINWNMAGENLTIRWSEHNGPMTVPPVRKGFGDTVIVQMAEHTLEGHVNLEYAPTGLVWEITGPADRALEQGL